KALSQFQAVQQNLAVLATHAAVAGMAAVMAQNAVATGHLFPDIAIAKARAGESAGLGAAIAHQIHGAIGFTLDHDLQFSTKRLWSWRDEFGNEAAWNLAYGRHLASAGAELFWPAITAAS
ncbi:MAG TPA: acyl-CoA dehydrogenase family protein, partial [Acetobacteraceae bacterium]|nr:acyl-CoA dehydrogenase family protein [Acetobacteraceae bacterium]